MSAYKYAGFLYIIVIFAGNAIGAESNKSPLSTDAPPSAIEFTKILLKNGTYIEESCNTVVYGATLQDKLISLVAPEYFGYRTVVTYRCLDDGRETGVANQVIPVWNCTITGRAINSNDFEVYSTSIVAYLDKTNLKIVDLLCL